MPTFLSQAWLDLHASGGADLPVRKGSTALLQMVVTGGPDGEVSYVLSIEDGQVAAADLGTVDDADLTLTCSLADGMAIAKGTLDLNVAYMQGRAKLVGDVGALMAVLPVTQSSEYRALLAAVAAQTDF